MYFITSSRQNLSNIHPKCSERTETWFFFPIGFMTLNRWFPLFKDVAYYILSKGKCSVFQHIRAARNKIYSLYFVALSSYALIKLFMYLKFPFLILPRYIKTYTLVWGDRTLNLQFSPSKKVLRSCRQKKRSPISAFTHPENALFAWFD